MRVLVSVLVGAVALGLTACQSTPPITAGSSARDVFPSAAYKQAQAQGQIVYDLDPEASTLRAYAYRAGPMARQGHNHVIAANEWRGAVALNPDKPEAARLDLRIPVASLEVDPPAVREALGYAFHSELDGEARAGTRDNMLSSALLAAEAYPAITVSLVSVRGELPRPILTLAVTVRANTAEVEVPAAVTRSQGVLRAQGRFVLRHSALGLEPFSAAGGALRVADAVTVEFDLVGRRRASD